MWPLSDETQKATCTMCGAKRKKPDQAARDSLRDFRAGKLGAGLSEMALRCKKCGKVFCVQCVAPYNGEHESGDEHLRRSFTVTPEDALKFHFLNVLRSVSGGWAVCPSCRERQVGIYMRNEP